MYKLYIGDYLKEGTPATWTINCTVPKRHLKKQVNEIVPLLRQGMELYIVHDNEVHAYFRENLENILRINKMKICQWCGKEITRTDKFKYCSQECYQKATIHNQNEKRKLMPKKEPQPLTVKRCKNCGKEFMQKVGQQVYCCYDCSLEYNCKKEKLREKIRRIAKKFGFELKNLDKIVNAKMRFFDDGERHRCPCDSQNPNRYCGSALCIHDTIANSHCHCNLFHAKKTLQDYENGL